MRVNRRIIFTLIFISFLFLTLVAYLTYFTLFQSDKISQNPFNKRQWAYEDDILRGSILDRNGIVLAKSDMTDSGQIREYPYKNLYCHVIGYNSQTYGKSQLESKYNNLLIGKDELSSVFSMNVAQKAGFNLDLTIDHRLQELASNDLGNHNGAVVAMNPQTGEILAMVSKPDFDPNNDSLVHSWNSFTDDKDAPLLPRVTNGLYAPGSTFKIVTAAASIENGLQNMTFHDTGEVDIDGKKIENYKRKIMGDLDIKNAFALSSNYAFATLGVSMGGNALRDEANKFGFDKAIDFDLPTTKCNFPEKNLSKLNTGLSAIGQYDVRATPLQMLLTTAVIANKGDMPRPYLVSKAVTQSGNTIFTQGQSKIKQVIDPQTAASIADMMSYTVSNGTGASAAIKGIQVCGKTGTAENEKKDKNHAWFVSYAPKDNPTIAVAVVLEYSGGSGGELAAPIARDLMKLWLGK